MKRHIRDLSRSDIAKLIERFLEGKGLYLQEWNDFVESPQYDQKLDIYRRRCYELDPLVNRPGDPDAEAVSELRSMIETLNTNNSGSDVSESKRTD